LNGCGDGVAGVGRSKFLKIFKEVGRCEGFKCTSLVGTIGRLFAW
jgi:hypothetical protein